MGFSLSVVIPNHNDSRFLPTALDAVLSQSVQPLEIIVADDASTDGSREVIGTYAARFPTIRPVYLEQNRGVIAIMNRFAEEAAGDYIYFAAADDFILPGFFARSQVLLERHPQAALCSTLSLIADTTAQERTPLVSPVPDTDDGFIDRETGLRLLLRHDSWVNGNTAIYRRDAILAEDGFRPELEGFSDGYMHRLLIAEHGVCFLPEMLACWRWREGGMSDRTNTNPEILTRVVNATVRLMQEDGKSRFPAAYIERWRRRTLFGALRACFARGDFGVMGSEPFGLGQFDIAIARMLLSLGVRLPAEFYLFLRLRPFDLLQLAARRFRRIMHSPRATTPAQPPVRAGDASLPH